MQSLPNPIPYSIIIANLTNVVVDEPITQETTSH